MWSTLLSNEAIIAMVGHEAFARGMVYARNGSVSEVQIDPATQLISGRVQGGYRDGYDSSVQLVGTEAGLDGASRDDAAVPWPRTASTRRRC